MLRISNGKTSNEKKNLNRLAGEFLVASRLAQCGYMVSLQWGMTIGYDILVFDKGGNMAFLEVKSSAQYPRCWMLQKKYASPESDDIPIDHRFICCVDLATGADVYVFPAKAVAQGLRYRYSGKFPDSPSYQLSLGVTPKGRTKTVGKFICADSFLENYAQLGIEPVLK